MQSSSSETLYSVAITGLRDDAARRRVAQTIAGSADEAAAARIEARLGSLPLTITRQASRRKAAKLKELLQGLGAEVAIDPPIADLDSAAAGETQVLPRFETIPETAPSPASPPPSPSRLHEFAPPAPPESSDRDPEIVWDEPARPATEAPSSRASAIAEFSGAPVQPLMSDMGEGVTMEPLTVGGILDRTFQLSRSVFWKLLAIEMLPWLVGLTLGGLAAGGGFLAGVITTDFSGLQPWSIVVLVGLAGSLTVVLLFLWWWSRVAAVHLISEAYLGREVGVREAFRFGMTRLVPFLLTDLLRWLLGFGLAIVSVFTIAIPFVIGSLVSPDLSSYKGWLVLLALLLLAVPLAIAAAVASSYVWLKTHLFDKAIIIENLAYVEAMQRSWHLLTGRAYAGWDSIYLVRLLCLLILFWFISLAISLLFQVPGQVVSVLLAQIGPGWAVAGMIVAQLSSFLASIVVAIFAEACMVIFYYDIRIRREGLDIAMDVADAHAATGRIGSEGRP